MAREKISGEFIYPSDKSISEHLGIGVSIDKTPEQIALNILQRLMPFAVSYWEDAEKVSQKIIERNNEREARKTELRKLGFTFHSHSENEGYLDNPYSVKMWQNELEITRMKVSLEQLKQILLIINQKKERV
jgi:hypothetical protein